MGLYGPDLVCAIKSLRLYGAAPGSRTISATYGSCSYGHESSIRWIARSAMTMIGSMMWVEALVGITDASIT